MKVYYIANTGFLLEHNGKKVLIDGIHTKQVDPYQSVDKDTINKMITGESPFDNLDLILVTHYHWDHLDGETVLKVLRNHPNTKLFSSKQTVDFIKTLDYYNGTLDDQLISEVVDIKTVKFFNINDVHFSVASLIHDGNEFKDVINFTYIITFDDITIFHCGDAKPNQDNYMDLGLDKQNITLALLDFPYISLPSGRKVINNYIKPDKVLLMHLPNVEKDTYNWLKTVHKVAARYSNELPNIIFCEEPNTTIQV